MTLEILEKPARLMREHSGKEQFEALTLAKRIERLYAALTALLGFTEL